MKFTLPKISPARILHYNVYQYTRFTSATECFIKCFAVQELNVILEYLCHVQVHLLLYRIVMHLKMASFLKLSEWSDDDFDQTDGESLVPKVECVHMFHPGQSFSSIIIFLLFPTTFRRGGK